MRKPENLTGQRFGQLVAIELTETHPPKDAAHRYWRCRCDCGGEALVTASDLKRGKVYRCHACRNSASTVDLAGQRFGRLVATQQLPPEQGKKSHCYRWLCKCDCGNTCIVPINDLVSGNTKSCGCLQIDTLKMLYYDGTAPCKLVEKDHVRATNTSGYTGVYWDKAKQSWAAEITFRSKKYHLGRYAKIEEAAKAYRAAKEKTHLDFLQWYNENVKEPTK